MNLNNVLNIHGKRFTWEVVLLWIQLSGGVITLTYLRKQMKSKKPIEKTCKYVDCGKTFKTILNKKQFCSTACQQNNKQYLKNGVIPTPRTQDIPKKYLVRGKISAVGSVGHIHYAN